MPIRFKRFQSRLLIFFLVPLLVVLSAVFLIVARANTRIAVELITLDMQKALANFEATISERNETLAIAGDTLSSDFAFKNVYETNDHLTILTALTNLLGRLVNADFLVLVNDQDGTVIADTLQPALIGVEPTWSNLINSARILDRAGEYPEAADVVIVNGHPYHLTVLPFFNPELVAWLGLGFELNQTFTENFKKTISADVSVLFKDTDQLWHINGSTMPDSTQGDLQSQFNNIPNQGLDSLLTLDNADYVTMAKPISQDLRTVEIVLQRSLKEQLAPYEELQGVLFTIFALGLAILAAGIVFISRTVTHPLLLLAQGARRIRDGDYQQQVIIAHQDEFGELAQSFNGMVKGLIEKEKVRDLLGKVVSPQIANELLSKNLELGGEEIELTVLFCDMRDFTTLCEGKTPQQILQLLNEYFSAISGVIESNGGVVDKYIGDAVMALFGAPVSYADAPSRAIRTALTIYKVLDEVNTSFSSRGLSTVTIGVGINTDTVVVGNVGSSTRLNYTALGDGVNLASRLEELTKRYGVNIIVSEFTRNKASEFLYQELDMVRVKGKSVPVRIFSPLMFTTEATLGLLTTLDDYHAFIRVYQAGNFITAQQLLDVYTTRCQLTGFTPNHTIINLYRDRLHKLQADVPVDWDGVHTFTHK